MHCQTKACYMASKQEAAETYKVGKTKRKPMQMMNVMAPSMMKIHRHPLYP